MKILCVGPLWRGSNAGGIFKALGRQGALIEIVDEYYHIPLNARSLHTKLIAKGFRNLFLKDFNQEILNSAAKFEPDLVLVYKGAFVLPETLILLKNKNIPLYNFYPDVSFHTHGKLLVKTLGLFDKIFTTKTFGIKDLNEQLNIKNAVFIPHGFDPEIHRPIEEDHIPKDYICDLSFIGTYSPKKERILSQIVQHDPALKVLIWGDQWEKAKEKSLQKAIRYKSILGDLYAAGISASKINLAILSEKVIGSSSGDLITSRTFHIPATGGFMLHERNEQSIKYFQESAEAAFFTEISELNEKIRYYLREEIERNKIAKAGMLRAQKDHSLDERAKQLLSYF